MFKDAFSFLACISVAGSGFKLSDDIWNFSEKMLYVWF